MNIIEIQDNLKDLPDNALMQEMQMPTGSAPQFLVLSELKRRKRMRDEYQRRQNADMKTVAEETITAAGMPQGGIMDAARAMAPQTNVAQNTGMDTAMPIEPTQAPQPEQPMMMAGGGIVNLREGGKVFQMGGAEFALFDDGEVYRIAPNGRRFKAPEGLAKGVREFAAQAELLQQPAQAEEITSKLEYTPPLPDPYVSPAELSPVTPSPTVEEIAQNYPELVTQSAQIAMEGVDTPASLEQIIAQGARNYGTKSGMPKGFMGDPRLQGGIVEEMRGTGMPAAAEPPEYIPSNSSPTGFIDAKTGRPVSGSVAEGLQSQQDQQDLLNPRAVGTVGFGFDDLTLNDLLRRQEGIDRREKERGERAEAFSREEGRFDPRPEEADFYAMDSILRDQQKQRAALGEGIMQGRAGPLTGASEEPSDPSEIVDQSGQNLTDAFSFSNLTSGGLGGTPFVSAGIAKDLVKEGSEEIDALSTQKQIQTINEQIAATDDPYMLEALRKKKNSLELLQRSGENIAMAADELNQAVGGVFNPNVAMNKLTSLDNRAAGNIAAFFGETDFAADQFKRAAEKQEAADSIVDDAEIKAAQRKEEIERNRVNRGSVPVLLSSPPAFTEQEKEDVLSPLVAPDVELKKIEEDATETLTPEQEEAQAKLEAADITTKNLINNITNDTNVKTIGGAGTNVGGATKEALAQKGLNTEQWLAIAMMGAGLASGNPADIGKSVQAGLSYLQKDKQGKMAYDARMKEIASREKIAGITAGATGQARSFTKGKFLFEQGQNMYKEASYIKDGASMDRAIKLMNEGRRLMGLPKLEGSVLGATAKKETVTVPSS